MLTERQPANNGSMRSEHACRLSLGSSTSSGICVSDASDRQTNKISTSIYLEPLLPNCRKVEQRLSCTRAHSELDGLFHSLSVDVKQLCRRRENSRRGSVREGFQRCARFVRFEMRSEHLGEGPDKSKSSNSHQARMNRAHLSWASTYTLMCGSKAAEMGFGGIEGDVAWYNSIA
jgi:hypothetical protein